MCEKIQSTSECRPLKHLTGISKNFPYLWKSADSCREDRSGLPDWPDWCFFPLGGWMSLIEESHPSKTAEDYIAGMCIGAIGTWRTTQGIYRFDATLYESIIRTPVEGDLPCEIIFRLPEWCVYVETPGMTWDGANMHGFFAHLSWEGKRNQPELRLVIDEESGLMPYMLCLGPWSLTEAVARTASIAKSQWNNLGFYHGNELDKSKQQAFAEQVSPLLSMVIYLCCQNAEINSGDRVPSMPKPTRTKKGLRHFPPNKPTTWDVGVRIGAALRKAYQAQSHDNGDGTHASPRPHIRRAHWHGFRSGPRKLPGGNVVPLHDRAFELKWLPPIAVNLESPDDLPVTLHPIKDAA